MIFHMNNSKPTFTPPCIEVSMTGVIHGLIVNHEGTIRVLQGGVGGKDGVVGLNYCYGNLGG